MHTVLRLPLLLSCVIASCALSACATPAPPPVTLYQCPPSILNSPLMQPRRPTPVIDSLTTSEPRPTTPLNSTPSKR